MAIESRGKQEIKSGEMKYTRCLGVEQTAKSKRRVASETRYQEWRVELDLTLGG